MEGKIKKIGLRIEEMYTNLDDMYIKGKIWSEKGNHGIYEIGMSAGEVIEWLNKNKIIERHKKYINSITE